MATSRRPVVTLFSRKNPGPASQVLIQERYPNIPTKIIDAGDGYTGVTYGLEKTMTAEELKELTEAEILLTDPPLVMDMLYQFPNLKWMQITWAGVDHIIDNLDKSKPLPSYTLTRFAATYGVHMREYVIGHIIAWERTFDVLREDQAKKEWHGSMRANYRLLSSLSIGILGVGEIGKYIAEACKVFGMTVWGLVRQDLPSEKRSPHVDHYRQIDGLGELLQNCDYVCNVLPSTSLSRGLLNGNMLENCKERNSVFINIGRGDVISEDDLVNALRKGWIAGAVLDVFPIEPLPEQSPLWDMKQVKISPHNSGVNKESEVIDVLAENYEKYVKGENLNNVVDWEQGY